MGLLRFGFLGLLRLWGLVIVEFSVIGIAALGSGYWGFRVRIVQFTGALCV